MSTVHVLIYNVGYSVMQSGYSQASCWKLKVISDSRQNAQTRDFLSSLSFKTLEEAENFAKSKKYNFRVAKYLEIIYNKKSYVDVITKDPVL